jgi:hypothetical protein
MTNTDVSLASAFGLPPPVAPVVIPEPITAASENIETDYDFSRSNIRSLLKTGQEALEKALEVAKSSEEPRAFEVVGTILKQLADINQQLIGVHQQKKKLDAPIGKELPASAQTTNNSIFVGSTAELTRLISGMNTKTIDMESI